MAKWDLSKLPEGRKPLDDSWFRERAQMQERIAELEAKVLECGMDIEAVQLWGSENENEISELRAKLAKAVGLVDDMLEWGTWYGEALAEIRQRLAELKGQSDD
jgi:hypothetical protein